MLKLERIFYPEIHSSVNIQEEGSMEIENRFSLNVNFDNKNQNAFQRLKFNLFVKRTKIGLMLVLKLLVFFRVKRLILTKTRNKYTQNLTIHYSLMHSLLYPS